MIRSWKHKGLKKFYESGSKAGILPNHESRLRRRLNRLNASTKPEDMNVPGWDFHGLQGNEAGIYSVSVNGNWRVTFAFEGTDAVLVDYRDYH